MIVKNEESNIERALSWAKGIAFEQIVVDTGSTDRTVELAESMGAIVRHFEWIDDFSAAKNFAMEQAKGNWIAILDADEWITDTDTPKLMEYLQLCTNNSSFAHIDVLRSQLVNLDDEGKPFHAMTHIRFIRNHRNIHYTGAIHEALTADAEQLEMLEMPDVTILHTGYQRNVYESTDKLDRNIEMIRRELEKNPGLMNKAYLADSLIEKTDDASKAEALMLYKEIADSDERIPDMLERNAFLRTVAVFLDAGEMVNAELYTRKALELMPDFIDFNMLMNEILYKIGRYAEAWESIKTAEELFEKHALHQPNAVINEPVQLFNALCLTAVKLDDTQNAVKYATLVLKEDKMRPHTLGPLLMTLKRFGNTEDDEILAFIEKLYDFGNPRDKVFLARVANSVELFGLRDMVLARITSEERMAMAAPETEGLRG